MSSNYHEDEDDRGLNIGGIAKLVGIGVFSLFFLILFLGCWFTVGQGERAVITHFGAVVGEVGPGLHFKVPFLTGAQDISIQPTTVTYGTEAPVQAYSRDQQPANMRISVTWHVIDAARLYGQYYSLDNAVARIITPRVYEQDKNIFGRFNAVEAIQERANLNAQITAAIQTSVKGAPFVIDSVQVENIDFSDTYEKAVEARMEATVKEQQALAQKNQRMTNADASAYEVKAAADAKAHQIEVQGNAEANAIKARGDALRNNPELVQLTAAEKWDGQLPTTMLPGGSVPFVNLGNR